MRKSLVIEAPTAPNSIGGKSVYAWKECQMFAPNTLQPERSTYTPISLEGRRYR